MRIDATPRWAGGSSSESLGSSSADESPQSPGPPVRQVKKGMSRGSRAALGLSLVAASVALGVICFLLGRLQLIAARESETIASVAQAVHSTVDVALAAGEEHGVYARLACRGKSVLTDTSAVAASARTDSALSQYRELSEEQRAHLDPELAAVFEHRLDDLDGARRSCARLETGFQPPLVLACRAPFRNASAIAIRLAASAVQHHEVGTATLLRLLSWSDFVAHMSEASVWRGILDHDLSEEYIQQFHVYAGATVALGQATMVIDTGPNDQEAHKRVRSALALLQEHASIFSPGVNFTVVARPPHFEWRAVLSAAGDAAAERISYLRRASVVAAEARAAEARSLLYTGASPLIAVSFLLLALLRVAYRAERRRAKSQHVSDLAQRAAIQYSLHHTRNPLHQLAALVTMLRDALPPSARNLSRVKWAFHELHSSLRTMTAVVDYTLLMDTPFKPVHRMVPVEVHIPSFSRDLVFQHAELLPGVDMRYFVHRDVPPYVLTDGNWLRRALSAVLMEGARLSSASRGGVVELECRVLSTEEAEALEQAYGRPTTSYLSHLHTIQESGGLRMDSSDSHLGVDDEPGSALVWALWIVHSRTVARRLRYLRGALEDPSTDVGESAHIVREGLGGQVGVGCDDDRCDCPEFLRLARGDSARCGAEDGFMCGPSEQQQRSRWARMGHLCRCASKGTQLSVWVVVPVATGGSSVAAPPGGEGSSLEVAQQQVWSGPTMRTFGTDASAHTQCMCGRAHGNCTDSEGTGAEDEHLGAGAAPSLSPSLAVAQPGKATATTASAVQPPELPPLPSHIMAPHVAESVQLGQQGAVAEHPRPGARLPPLPPPPVRPQSSGTDAPGPAPASPPQRVPRSHISASTRAATEIAHSSSSLPGPRTVAGSHAPLPSAPSVRISEQSQGLSPSTLQSAPPSSASASASGTSPPQHISPPEGGGPYRILVVDDERLNRRFACHVMQKLGHAVESAADGDEVLPRVEAAEREGRGFHYVMLDLIMLRVHGDTACRQLRGRGYRGPIFCITANTDEGNLNRCRAAGFDAIFAKPCRPTDLRAALYKHPPPAALWAGEQNA